MLKSILQHLVCTALNCRRAIFSVMFIAENVGPSARGLELHTRKTSQLSRQRHSCVTPHTLQKLHVCCVISLLAASMNVTAQDKEEVQTELIAEVRVESVDAANRRVVRFMPATVLSQGEVVYYTVRIRNLSTRYVRDIVVTQRIPANTIYVEHSAAAPGADVSFSIDSGLTFAPREKLQVVDASGRTQIAPPEEYTHIRWRLRNALAPGAVALARFRAVFQ